MRRGVRRRRPSPPPATHQSTYSRYPLRLHHRCHLKVLYCPHCFKSANPPNSRSCRPSAGSQTPWSIVRHACMPPETCGDGQGATPAAPLARRASRAPRPVLTGETRRPQLCESRGWAKAGRRASSAPPPPPAAVAQYPSPLRMLCCPLTPPSCCDRQAMLMSMHPPSHVLQRTTCWQLWAAPAMARWCTQRCPRPRALAADCRVEPAELASPRWRRRSSLQLSWRRRRQSACVPRRWPAGGAPPAQQGAQPACTAVPPRQHAPPAQARAARRRKERCPQQGPTKCRESAAPQLLLVLRAAGRQRQLR